jgi:hypothetical protein
LPSPDGIVVVKNGSGAEADAIQSGNGIFGGGRIVSETEFGGIRDVAAAIAKDGTFVVAFARAGKAGRGTPLTLARRYDASGNALGDEFLLSGMTGGVELAPLPSGGFVAVDVGPSAAAGDGMDVHARRFAPAAKPAEIDRVYVRGTEWASSVLDLYENSKRGSAKFGYAAGGTPNPLPLPWGDLDQVSISFTQDVPVESDDLRVTGAGGSSYAVRDFDYDAERKTATWTFDRAVGADRLNVVLDAPGVHYELPLNVLPGDVDRSGRVNALDLAALRPHQGGVLDSQYPNFLNTYLSVMDLNGDGRINALDLAAARRGLNRSLPAAATALLR